MTIPGLGLPVRSIYCIGRNYTEHAKELGNAVPDKPMVFLKPQSALQWESSKLEISPLTQNVHHEVELVLAIGGTATAVPAGKATELIAGYAIGIDFTARDLQDEAKKKGHPWTLSKGLPGFAPIGGFVTKLAFPTSFSLKVNGTEKQRGDTALMIFGVEELVRYLAETFTLLPGDLIFTGTPEGVGPVKRGDVLEAQLGGGLSHLTVRVH